MPLPLSVLDLAPIVTGSNAGEALRNSLELARLAERLGFNRYWVAEHHNMPGIASSAPAVLIGAVLSCVFTLPLSTPFAATGKDVLLLAILGVFQLAVPCVMMLRASAHLSAPELALLGLLEVLMGPLWSWLGAGEVPGGTTLIGGAIVLAALIANEIVPKRRVA